jgi:hypothetical protein
MPEQFLCAKLVSSNYILLMLLVMGRTTASGWVGKFSSFIVAL